MVWGRDGSSIEKQHKQLSYDGKSRRAPPPPPKPLPPLPQSMPRSLNHSLLFPSLLFPSLPFPSLPFPSLPFSSLLFPSLPLPRLQAYRPLALKLFHASFVSCWLGLLENTQVGCTFSLGPAPTPPPYRVFFFFFFIARYCVKRLVCCCSFSATTPLLLLSEPLQSQAKYALDALTCEASGISHITQGELKLRAPESRVALLRD